MQKLMGLVRRCVDDYNMIEAGDRIAVGVSGGKDSLVLLTLLAGLKEYFGRRTCNRTWSYKLNVPKILRWKKI